ncbi:MAG: hypothetical protein ABIT01_03690 [Thermoanaerobaculia bacterium]
MDITFAWSDPAVLFLAAGATFLGIGATLVRVYHNLTNGRGSWKRVAVVSAASACFIAAPILIAHGW